MTTEVRYTRSERPSEFLARLATWLVDAHDPEDARHARALSREMAAYEESRVPLDDPNLPEDAHVFFRRVIGWLERANDEGHANQLRDVQIQFEHFTHPRDHPVP